jgi:hypothetical protein
MNRSDGIDNSVGALVISRPCANLFFQAEDLEASMVLAVAEWLGARRSGWNVAFVRAGGSPLWTAIDDQGSARTSLPAEPGPWRIEFADAARGAACRVKAVRSSAWRGQILMSSLCVDFPIDVDPAELTAFMVWSAEHLPVWWGTAGQAFQRAPTWGFLLDDDALRALAKRYWAAQVLDPVLLLRDARTGMPGIGWLSLVSAGFASTRELGLAQLASCCAGMAAKGVFHRFVGDALIVAAGPRPILGDINLDEDLTAYACVADLLAPLTTESADPDSGPQQNKERYAAWLARYRNPSIWLDAS